MKQKIILTTVFSLILTSQLVTAGSITDTYTKGDTLTATKMNSIKNAINDNDSNISTNTGNISSNTTGIAIKQDRVTGSCAGNLAINEILSDGSVNCQSTFPKTGYVSISAVAARNSIDGTDSTVWSGTGYHARGPSDSAFLGWLRLNAPVHIPHGATITSFSHTVYDNHDTLNGSADLVRDDGTFIASVTSSGNAGLETIATELVSSPETVVDNNLYGYYISMRSAVTAPNSQVLAVRVTIGYTLP